MGRNRRVHCPNGFYHTILRGNNRQAIFFTAADRGRWEDLLTEALSRYDARIHTYCWMTNHVHLLIQVSEQPLSSIIQFAAAQYARQTNILLGRTGHLFERRYRAHLVCDDAYLLRLVRYIHSNPLRARIVSVLEDYSWSSHRDYLGRRVSEWLTTNLVLRMFDNNLSQARVHYRQFMNSPDADFDAYQSDDEDADLRPHAESVKSKSPAKSVSIVKSTSLDQIIAEQSALSSITRIQLTGPARTRNITRVRAEIARLAIQQGVATLADVARALNRSESAVSQLIRNRRPFFQTKT